MAASRNRKHIVVGSPSTDTYRPHPRNIPSGITPAPVSRPDHGKVLKQAFEAAVREALQRRANAGNRVLGAVPGLYVQFESQPGVPLALSSLEDARQGIALVAVSSSGSGDHRIECATVFVPEGKVRHFIARFEIYAETAPRKRNERRHHAMLDPVATLRLATLRGLWTDDQEVYPNAGEVL